MSWSKSKKPGVKYDVKQKEAHYSELLNKQDSVSLAAVQTAKEARRVSYAAGYTAAVKDCREALLNATKTKK